MLRLLDPGVFENAVEQTRTHVLLRVNRDRDDALRGRVPELAVAAFPAPKFIEAVLLQ